METMEQQRSDQAGPGDPPPVASRLDPTKMANQPALRTSNGLVWLIMGGLFAAASLVPFAALAACMLTMAGVALVLVWVCLLLEAGPRGP